jgi:hypothetical protein
VRRPITGSCSRFGPQHLQICVKGSECNLCVYGSAAWLYAARLPAAAAARQPITGSSAVGEPSCVHCLARLQACCTVCCSMPLVSELVPPLETQTFRGDLCGPARGGLHPQSPTAVPFHCTTAERHRNRITGSRKR